MSETFQDCEGVEIIMDDILVHGPTLKCMMNNWRKCSGHNLKLNPRMTKLRKEEVRSSKTRAKVIWSTNGEWKHMEEKLPWYSKDSRTKHHFPASTTRLWRASSSCAKSSTNPSLLSSTNDPSKIATNPSLQTTTIPSLPLYNPPPTTPHKFPLMSNQIMS